MKEPDLEENDLRAMVEGDRLVVTRQSLEPDDRPVSVTLPDGSSRSLTLTPDKGGRSSGGMNIAEMGLYRVTDGARTALAAAGPLNPIELADVRTTPDKLAPVAAATGGGVFWVGLGECARIAPDSARPDRRRQRLDGLSRQWRVYRDRAQRNPAAAGRRGAAADRRRAARGLAPGRRLNARAAPPPGAMPC